MFCMNEWYSMTERNLNPATDAQEVSGEAQGDGMRQVLMLAISMAILQIGFGIVTPIFPFYVLELGVGGLELGVLAASFAITRIFFSGPLGIVSDRVGRKPVLLFGLIGFCGANIVYAFADTIMVMVIARALEGGLSAGFFPAANALVSDVTGTRTRGAAMGYMNIGNMVGLIVGPTVGGVLAEFLGLRVPFLVAALATLCTVISVQVLVKEPRRAGSPDSHGHMPGSRVSTVAVLRRRPVAYSSLALSMFASMFAVSILQVAFVLDVVQNSRGGWNVTPLEIGLFFGMIGIVTVIGSIGFGRLSDKRGRKWFIVSGGLMGTCSMVLFLTSTTLSSLYLAGFILALSLSLQGPTSQALVADLTDRYAYGALMGLFGAVSNSAFAASSLLSGFLYDLDNSSTSSLIIGSLVALVGTGAAALGLPRQQSREPPAPQDSSGQ